MIEFVQTVLGPYYFWIKFFHLLAVAFWVASTSVAYSHYLVPVFKAWRRNPDDQQIIVARDWVMERFDEGAVLEHVAFPVVLLTGVLLFVVGGYNADSNWLMLKLVIVIGVFIPIEVMDYYLAHFGGNKRLHKDRGDVEAYEKFMKLHWSYLVYVSFPIMSTAIFVIFLAVVKPDF